MHVLMMGGTYDHPGGVEAFCDRSKEALEARGEWRIERMPTNTAYLTMGRIPAYVRGIAKMIGYRKARPDVVWLQYVNLPDLGYLAVAKVFRMRVMVTPHLGSNWRSQSNPLLRRLSGAILRRADRFALISKTQEREINLPSTVPRSFIRNFLPQDILDSKLPDPAGSSTELQLIHSGRLSEGKGSFLVVDVCARLRDAGVPFHARITGGADTSTYDHLAAMIADYRLEGQVEVLGRVPEADLLDHLRASDVLIHLSRIDSYPLIVLEAMACSMFPICLELAGARDMVETFDGHIVSEADPVGETADFLARALLVDLRDRGRVAAAGVRAEYSWGNAASKLESAIRDCTANSSPAWTR